MTSRQDAVAANRRLWNEWAEINARSDFYDREAFVNRPEDPRPSAVSQGVRLRPYEVEEVGDVRGLDLLHLQCHFGLDTLSWARLGARVTGVDFSDRAIAAARELADESGLEARFICATYEELPDVLDEEFDVVYMSRGVLGWLPDMGALMRTVTRYLRTGGIFYLTEAHPILHTLDERGSELRVRYPYFERGEPLAFGVEGSYADRDAPVVEPLEYFWPHSLGEIITAVAEAGMRIEFLHEFPHAEAGWQIEILVPQPDGTLALPAEVEGELPLFFSLRAARTG